MAAAAGLAGAILLVFWLLARLIRRFSNRGPGLVFWIAVLTTAPWLAGYVFFPAEPWVGHLAALLWVAGAMLAWLVFDRIVFGHHVATRRDVHVPIILRQFIGAIVLFGAVAAVLTWIYKKEVTGLLATSGIAAVILGFAMQDLLSNVIAGFSIHLTRAYKIGDWLVLEGDRRRAEVREINWRSTRLLDNDQVSIEIPNSELVKGRIVNLNHPAEEHAIRIRFGLDYDVPPNVAKETLLTATRGIHGILENPPPDVFLIEYADSAILYELRVWMRQARLYNATCDGIRTALWYELRRRGFKIPFPIRTLERRDSNTPRSLTTARQTASDTLRRSDPFTCLSPEQSAELTAAGTMHLFGKGEAVVTRDQEGSSMFLILEGEADVVGRTEAGARVHIATLGVGDCFGEMSLLTGEPRNATVRAKSDLFALEIGKAQLAPLFEELPELVEKMGQLLEHRQRGRSEAFRKGDAPDNSPPSHADTGHSIVARIRRFFSHDRR